MQRGVPGEPGKRRRVAAVDVGTNTVRLLVADEWPRGEPGDVVREAVITRLGEGVDASRVLTEAALARTADAVAGFVARARQLGADRLVVAGTSALRDADNAGAFDDAVYARCGERVRVLSGEEEARLAWMGAGGRGTVLDVGGGSTELVTADGGVSLPVGSVRLRERILRNDPAPPDRIAQAAELVDHLLDEVPLARAEPLVGVAGTITTLAMLVHGLTVWRRGCVHGRTLDAGGVETWADRLLAMPAADVRRLPGVEPGRADVLASGVLICHRVMRKRGFDTLVVSERDILDGLASST